MKEINNYLMEITKKIFTVKTVIVFLICLVLLFLFSSWIDFPKATLDRVAAAGGKILFDLTNVSDLQNVLVGTGEYANKITSQELRYIMANWDRFKNVVTFCINEIEVAALW